MAHGRAKAVEALNWAMFMGNEDADDKLKRVRRDMIAAAEAKDTNALLQLADQLFSEDHHRDDYENLKTAEEDDPGGPVRWARDLLKLPNEPTDQEAAS